jgi:uncharacterized protein with HEPN domain
MRREPRAYLIDARDAGLLIQQFLHEQTREEYLGNPLVRSAVERQFEIIGEALSQLARVSPGQAERVPNYRRIIAFRNVLAHGYSTIDHALVWESSHSDLDALLETLNVLLVEEH